MNDLNYRVTLYASMGVGIIFGLYGLWLPSVIFLPIALVLQWKRQLPARYEWTRRTACISILMLILIDIYGLCKPGVESVFGP